MSADGVLSNSLAHFVQLLDSGQLNKDHVTAQGWPLLHWTALQARDDLVRELLKRGAKLACSTPQELSALHMAVTRTQSDGEEAEGRRATIVRMLVSHGADIDAREARGWTALKYAVRFGLNRCATTLLACGADADLPDYEGYAPIHNAVVVAAQFGEAGSDLLRALLARARHLDARNDRWQTALIVAIMRQDIATAELLLQHHADPNAMDRDGRTPLNLAAQFGLDGLCSLLLAKGALANTVSGAEKRCPIHWAASAGYTDIARMLVRYGADVTVRDAEDSTALALAGPNLAPVLRASAAVRAAEKGDVSMLEALRLEGLDLNDISTASTSPLLHHAACYGQPEIIEYLIQNGVSVNEANSEDDTALHYAVARQLPNRSHAEVLRFLLLSHAKLNVQNRHGNTPLHMAAEKGFNQRVSALLEAGANQIMTNNRGELPLHKACCRSEALVSVVLLLDGLLATCLNRPCGGGWTPLMFAVKSNAMEIVRYLLDQGADVNAQQAEQGFTALHFAIQSRKASTRLRLCRLLVDAGADANAPAGKKRLTPLHFVCAKNMTPIIQLFYEHGGDMYKPDAEGDSAMSMLPPGPDGDEIRSVLLALREGPEEDEEVCSSWTAGSLSNTEEPAKPVPQPRRQRSRLSDWLAQRSKDGSRSTPELPEGSSPDRTLRAPGLGGDFVMVSPRNDGVTEPEDTLRAHALTSVVAKRLESLKFSHQASNESAEGGASPMVSELQSVALQIPSVDLPNETVLGVGAYSKVYQSSFNGQKVAVKLFMNLTEDEITKIFAKEVQILSQLAHKHIVRLIGYTTEPDFYAIVTELMELGSLHDVLHDQDIALSWTRRQQMALDAARGMQYLHSRNMLHRDLKSMNLLVDADFVVKVADFGMTKVRQHTQTLTTGVRGTPAYIAPESIDSKLNSEASDVYAFGIILYELATRRNPYYELQLDAIRLMLRVLRGERPPLPSTPEMPDGYAELAQQCWQQDFRLRPMFTEIVSWFENSLATSES